MEPEPLAPGGQAGETPAGREEAEAVVAAGPEELEPTAERGANGTPANGGEPRDELPAPEELAQRIPSEVLAAMDELFRAKWTVVKRLRPEDVKGGSGARGGSSAMVADP